MGRTRFMLLLTPAAAAQVAEVRRTRGLSNDVGLRISGEARDGGGLAVGLAFADVPAAGDEVTEQEGTRVFLAPEVIEPLAAVALDVEQTADGTRLILTHQ